MMSKTSRSIIGEKSKSIIKTKKGKNHEQGSRQQKGFKETTAENNERKKGS